MLHHQFEYSYLKGLFNKALSIAGRIKDQAAGRRKQEAAAMQIECLMKMGRFEEAQGIFLAEMESGNERFNRTEMERLITRMTGQEENKSIPSVAELAELVSDVDLHPQTAPNVPFDLKSLNPSHLLLGCTLFRATDTTRSIVYQLQYLQARPNYLGMREMASLLLREGDSVPRSRSAQRRIKKLRD
jgi:hypothetical protein